MKHLLISPISPLLNSEELFPDNKQTLRMAKLCGICATQAIIHGLLMLWTADLIYSFLIRKCIAKTRMARKCLTWEPEICVFFVSYQMEIKIKHRFWIWVSNFVFILKWGKSFKAKNKCLINEGKTHTSKRLKLCLLLN